MSVVCCAQVVCDVAELHELHSELQGLAAPARDHLVPLVVVSMAGGARQQPPLFGGRLVEGRGVLAGWFKGGASAHALCHRRGVVAHMTWSLSRA